MTVISVAESLTTFFLTIRLHGYFKLWGSSWRTLLHVYQALLFFYLLLQVIKPKTCSWLKHTSLEKKVSVSKSSEHPLGQGGKLSKRLVGGNIGCARANIFMGLI